MAETKARAARTVKTPKAAPTKARAKVSAPRTPRAKAATAKVSETVTARDTEKAVVRAAEAVTPKSSPAEAIAAPIRKAVESLMPKPVEAVQPALGAIDVAVQAMAATPRALPTDVAAAPVTALITTGAEQARQAYARAQATGQTLHQAVTEAATATSQGALEVNGKVIDAMRAQSDAAFDLWRATLTAGSVSEAIRAQTSGVRHVYETTASQWKDVAEATSRWLTAAAKPMQTVWSAQAR